MSNKSIQSVSSLKFSRMLKRNKTISQINVTPMVDVMLVLLVIFMITAPLFNVGVPIDLAKALPEDQTPLSITINKEEKIFVQNTEISLEKLIPKLISISKNRNDRKIFIRADKVLSYGKVVEVMAIISSAGFNKIALVTDFETKKNK